MASRARRSQGGHRDGTPDPHRLARWQDWVNLILGTWEFITPWIFAQSLYQGSPGNAWWMGGAIFVASLWLLSAPRSWWAEWLNALLGAWLFLSPWVLGFGTGAHVSPAAAKRPADEREPHGPPKPGG